MTYEEATAHLAAPRSRVTRSAWEDARRFLMRGPNGLIVTTGIHEISAYEPTAEDAAATDWKPC